MSLFDTSAPYTCASGLLPRVRAETGLGASALYTCASGFGKSAHNMKQKSHLHKCTVAYPHQCSSPATEITFDAVY